MKRFSFSLDRVLAWRRIEQEQERTALDMLTSDSRALTQRTETVIAHRRACEQSLSRASYFDTIDVATLPQWQSKVKQALAKLATEQQELSLRVEQQRIRLQDAERRVKLLERLRGRRLGVWEVALVREEEAFAAEAYLAGCIRLKGSNRRARSSGG